MSSLMAVAFIASALTFFSGFGLGRLLLPAFAIFRDLLPGRRRCPSLK
jgi:hypothetical protein